MLDATRGRWFNFRAVPNLVSHFCSPSIYPLGTTLDTRCQLATMDSEAVITFFLRFFIILGYVAPVTVVTLFRLFTGHVNVTIVASLLAITLVLWIVNLCITVSSDLRLRLYPALTASVLVHFLNLICISTQGLIEIVNPDDRCTWFSTYGMLVCGTNKFGKPCYLTFRQFSPSRFSL